MMEIDILQIIMVLIVTVTVSLVIELNNASKDIMHKKKKIPLYYISKTLLNAIIGSTTGFTILFLYDKPFMVFIVAILGTFLGKKSLIIITYILKNVLKAFKDIDVEKLLEDKDNDDDES